VKSFLHTLADLADERGLHALLIGGHAVTALGFPRATYDVDLLIRDSEIGSWKTALASLRLRLTHDRPPFLQFDPPADWPLPPVDLLAVDEATWQQLATESQPGVGSLRTPSTLGIVALKLHAAAQPDRAEEAARDWRDIFGLISAQGIPLSDPKLRETFLAYGGAQAIERLDAAAASDR
jgi:hypothetical protein